MQLDAILEVVIGLVFVWLVISVATLEIQNRISIILNWRADLLEKTMHDMLKDPELVKKLYNHPLIQQLTPRDKNNKLKRPDYIPNPIFASVAFEVIMNAGKDGDTIPVSMMSIEGMRESAKKLAETNPPLARTFQHMIPNLEKDVENFEQTITGYRLNMEDWFHNVMGQASTIYKQRAQIIAFFVGLGITLFLNIDTINIAQKLWQEPTIRAVLVAQAQTQATEPDLPSTDHLAKVQSLAFPIGWTTTVIENQSCSLIDTEDYQLVIRSAGQCRLLTGFPALNNGWGLLVKLCGFLLTALAAAQGAPFWFDILRKLVGIRPQSESQSNKPV
ncbi:MAG: hypothetical protein H7Y59_12750 [Anaerolineales bacterium]|nr:hypothetical protein [Anaerolineales bacterium]